MAARNRPPRPKVAGLEACKTWCAAAMVAASLLIGPTAAGAADNATAPGAKPAPARAAASATPAKPPKSAGTAKAATAKKAGPAASTTATAAGGNGKAKKQYRYTIQGGC